jgi:hypothetical protein
MGRDQHVVPDGKSGWGIRGEGNSRLTKAGINTQAEAINLGREIAINQQSELVIHRPDGRFREAWSYGNDPFPPPG